MLLYFDCVQYYEMIVKLCLMALNLEHYMLCTKSLLQYSQVVCVREHTVRACISLSQK